MNKIAAASVLIFVIYLLGSLMISLGGVAKGFVWVCIAGGIIGGALYLYEKKKTII
jgi:membrane associated rhomboid family serine protease